MILWMQVNYPFLQGIFIWREMHSLLDFCFACTPASGSENCVVWKGEILTLLRNLWDSPDDFKDSKHRIYSGASRCQNKSNNRHTQIYVLSSNNSRSPSATVTFETSTAVPWRISYDRYNPLYRTAQRPAKIQKHPGKMRSPSGDFSFFTSQFRNQMHRKRCWQQSTFRDSGTLICKNHTGYLCPQ